MKKLLIVLLFVFSVSLMSCPNPTVTQPIDPKDKLMGTWYNIYSTSNHQLIFMENEIRFMINGRIGSRFAWDCTDSVITYWLDLSVNVYPNGVIYTQEYYYTSDDEVYFEYGGIGFWFGPWTREK